MSSDYSPLLHVTASNVYFKDKTKILTRKTQIIIISKNKNCMFYFTKDNYVHTQVWISAGLEPVLNHTKKHVIYRITDKFLQDFGLRIDIIFLF